MPAIERLPGNAVAAAGQSHVVGLPIEIHPAEPPSGFPAQLHPNGLQPRRPGWLTVFNLHPDTLLESVTHHSEREHFIFSSLILVLLEEPDRSSSRVRACASATVQTRARQALL